MRGRTVALVGEGGRNGVVTLEGEGVRSAGTREGECVGEGRAFLDGEEGGAFLDGEEGRALLGEEGIAFLAEVVVTECVIGCTPTLNTTNHCNMTEATPLSLRDLHFHSVDLRIICGFHPHPPLQLPLFLVST